MCSALKLQAIPELCSAALWRGGGVTGALSGGSTLGQCGGFEPIGQAPQQGEHGGVRGIAGQPQVALRYLKTIAQTDVNYRAEPVGLLIAKSYAAMGDDDMARKSFDFVRELSSGFDVVAEYAIWAAQRGDWPTAHRLKAEMDKAMTRWSSQQRALNKDTLQRVKAAFAGQLQ